MTTFIVDETTSQTPIGELLQSMSDERIEMRNPSGALLATLIVADDRDDDERYEELQRLCEQEVELLRERMRRPAREGLTTAELMARLRQLGGDE